MGAVTFFGLSSPSGVHKDDQGSAAPIADLHQALLIHTLACGLVEQGHLRWQSLRAPGVGSGTWGMAVVDCNWLALDSVEWLASL